MLLIVLKNLTFMINSVYGKTKGNLRNWIKARLVNNEKDFKNTLANQLILLMKSLAKIMLLFMKLNQF